MAAKFENAVIFPAKNMLFVAGFVLSLIGSLPPGLISLTVAQTAIARTFSAAIVLAGGAAFAEFFQAWFAVEMSGWFLQNPEYIKCFQWGALPVFWSLAFYLFFMAKPASGTQAPVYQYNIPAQFLKGVLVSAFNLLAIPYWFVYCGWLRAEGWWPGNDLSMTLFFCFRRFVGHHDCVDFVCIFRAGNRSPIRYDCPHGQSYRRRDFFPDRSKLVV